MRFVLALLLLLNSALYPQESDADPQGWSKAKWGMTNEEILAASEGRVHWLKNMTAPRVGIEDLELEGRHYKVIFVPDKDGKLDWVSIIPHEVQSGHQSGTFKLKTHPTEAFTELNAALIRKYGKPSAQSSEVLEGWKHVLTTWGFRSTTIELKMQTHTRFEGMNLVELRYRRRLANPDL